MNEYNEKIAKNKAIRDSLISSNYNNFKLLKMCKNTDTNYFGSYIPEGAIYGKMDKGLYVYIDNYVQFAPAHIKHNKFVQVFIMDTQYGDTSFHLTKIYKNNWWFNLFHAFILYNNLLGTTCKPVVIAKQGDKPKRKEVPAMMFNMSYKQQKLQKWENTFTTDTDPTQKPRYNF